MYIVIFMKINKVFSFVILLLSFNFSLYAVPRADQDLILPKHWVYDAMISLELEMGRTTFSDQAPVSIVELKTYLDEIDFDRLSSVGKIQYQRIMDYISEKNWSVNYGLLSLGIEPTVNPEFYLKPNSDTPWIYDYTKRKPLIEMPIKLNVGNYLSVYMGLEASQNYKARNRNDNYFNQVFGIDYFDPALVHENYLSAGYTWDNNVGFNLKLGVGTQSIGHSMMPSIITSEYLTDAPYFNLRVFSPIFNYNCNITQLSRKTHLYTHRIEAILFKKIQFSFMEGVLPYGNFDLRMINPFSIYHGYGIFNEISNECSSFFGIKVNVTPIKYLRLYFLYAQNEHTMSSEENKSIPEGSGFQLGLESYIPSKKGYFHVGCEFYYANPYLFIKDNPNISFTKVFTEMVSGSGPYYQWLGSPLGPDSMAFQFAFGYEQPERWSIDFAYNFAALGEFSKDNIFRKVNWRPNSFEYDESGWVYPSNDPLNPYNDGAKYKAPHGIVEYQNSFCIKTSFKPTDFLTINFQPGYKIINNYGNQSGEFRHGPEFILGCEVYLTKLKQNAKSPDFLFSDGK